MKRAGASLKLALLLVFSAIPSFAAPGKEEPPKQICEMKELVSLDADTLPSGAIAIPVAVNGKPAVFEVDTGSVYSSMTVETAEQLGVKLKATQLGGEFMNGVGTNAFAYLDSFAIGLLHSDRRWPLIVAPNQITPADISGLLGPDIMRGYDVEFDFFRGKFNIFAHNTCPDPVYWTRTGSAIVPMELDSAGHIVVDASLDGKPVRILLDTGSPESVMSLEAARKLFGWSDNDARVRYVRTTPINGGADTPFYAFPFVSLNLEGLVVKNPKIQLIPQVNYDPHDRPDAEIVLGMSVLRHLHLYVAYGEQKLYLTDAEAL
jgi:predicted aspartyl protease